MNMARFRDESYIYTIHGESSYYYYTGRTPTGRQGFITILVPDIVALLFDRQGNFLSVEKRALADDVRELPVESDYSDDGVHTRPDCY